MTGTSVRGASRGRVSPASARTGSCGRERPTLRGPCGHHTCPRSHTSTAGEAAPALRLPGLPAPTVVPPGLRGLPRLQLPHLWVLCWLPGPHFRPPPRAVSCFTLQSRGEQSIWGWTQPGPPSSEWKPVEGTVTSRRPGESGPVIRPRQVRRGESASLSALSLGFWHFGKMPTTMIPAWAPWSGCSAAPADPGCESAG